MIHLGLQYGSYICRQGVYTDHALSDLPPMQGIPIIYYGTEQGFHGGNDPQDRESLWPNYNTSSDLYKFISILADFRTQQGSSLYESSQIERYVDDQFFAFTRGIVSVFQS